MKQWKTGAVLISLLGIMSGMMMAGAAEEAEIPLNSETFPDPAFLSWVSDRDTDRDGSLSQMELDAVTKMDLRKLGIQDLQGLEYSELQRKRSYYPGIDRFSRHELADLQ